MSLQMRCLSIPQHESYFFLWTIHKPCTSTLSFVNICQDFFDLKMRRGNKYHRMRSGK